MNFHYFGMAPTSDGVPGGVSKGAAGEVIIKAQPVYPAIAKQINASGEVQVSIVIGENGRVIEAKAIKGHPVLRSAAEDAARKWVFKPTEVGGRPVHSSGHSDLHLHAASAADICSSGGDGRRDFQEAQCLRRSVAGQRYQESSAAVSADCEGRQSFWPRAGADNHQRNRRSDRSKRHQRASAAPRRRASSGAPVAV